MSIKVDTEEVETSQLNNHVSPRVVTRDSQGVREGFTRLRHACQINFIRHDAIENFLFGDDYKLEGKLSILKVKQAV